MEKSNQDLDKELALLYKLMKKENAMLEKMLSSFKVLEKRISKTKKKEADNKSSSPKE